MTAGALRALASPHPAQLTPRSRAEFTREASPVLMARVRHQGCDTLTMGVTVAALIAMAGMEYSKICNIQPAVVARIKARKNERI